ncbi:MAG: sigma-70 family RNA polymerase sigma factor [Acidobacteria bacterium]|nr:sigma-70 family RNA polymerase sigma factor [Acidobacteriota bacterium]
MGFGLEGSLATCDLPVAAPEAHAEDDALVEGLRTGAEAAYEILIERFEHPVYNLVSRLLNDPTEACDVVQEVFLKVFRNIGLFRGQSSLKTWVYRIAVNEAHNHRRWFGRHRRQEVGFEREEENCRSYQEILPDPGFSPFDVVLGNEQHHLIENALETINPIFRSAVVLRDIEDMSYEEIAQILQVSLGTVKSRILRGREALREALADRLETAVAAPWAARQAGGVKLGSVKP